MKNFLIILCFSLITYSVFSQSTFDKSLNEVSADLAGKLSQKNKKKIVVLYVTDISKSQTVAGKYIADVISVNIVNDQGNFEVFDRENLSGIAEAKKLIAEGYIDADKVKELGKLLSVDAIIIGNYTVLTTTLKLTLKALDVNNGFVIAATMKDLPINEDAGTLLGINVGVIDNNSNKGFNSRPLNSNESYNNPGTVNSECKEKNTGDYCFINATDHQIQVDIDYRSNNSCITSDDLTMTLAPQQTQCFYNLKAVPWFYFVFDEKHPRCTPAQEGQINVEQCKSKTFVIKSTQSYNNNIDLPRYPVPQRPTNSYQNRR
jgi:hypothetical protein